MTQLQAITFQTLILEAVALSAEVYMPWRQRFPVWAVESSCDSSSSSLLCHGIHAQVSWLLASRMICLDHASLHNSSECADLLRMCSRVDGAEEKLFQLYSELHLDVRRITTIGMQEITKLKV